MFHFLLQTLFVAMASAYDGVPDVGFTITTGKDANDKYGVYWVGNFNDTRHRDWEQLVGVVPGSKPSDNKLMVKGGSGNGWIVRSDDLSFRLALMIERSPHPGDIKFVLSVKNWGEDDLDVNVKNPKKAESSKVKKAFGEKHPLAAGIPVALGGAAGKERILITLDDPLTK